LILAVFRFSNDVVEESITVKNHFFIK